MGIIRLRCSRKTVVLSGTDTHHRPVECSSTLRAAAYMRFRQHFSSYRWENQVGVPIFAACISGRSSQSVALSFSPASARAEPAVFFSILRQIALPRGEGDRGFPRERYMGKWVHAACLSLSGGCGFAASGGKMRRANAIGTVTNKIGRKAVQTTKGTRCYHAPRPFCRHWEGTRRASVGPVRRAVRAPWTCRMARARGDSCDGGLVPAAWLSGLSAVPTTLTCETGQRVSPPYALYPFLRRLCRRTVATA